MHAVSVPINYFRGMDAKKKKKRSKDKIRCVNERLVSNIIPEIKKISCMQNHSVYKFMHTIQRSRIYVLHVILETHIFWSVLNLRII